MDRVRAGLTGLGVVFLVTASAALLFGPEPGEVAAVEQGKEPGEPLAQLGVAPSNENPEPALPPAEPAAPPAASATPSARENPLNVLPGDGQQPEAAADDGPIARDVTSRV